MVTPYPPVLGKKRLKDVENKGSAPRKAEKKRLDVIENIEDGLQQRSGKTGRSWLDMPARERTPREQNLGMNVVAGLLRRAWSILLVR